MTSTRRAQAGTIPLAASLAAVAASSGLWAAARLSPDGRQNLALITAIVTLVAFIISRPRTGPPLRALVGAILLASAAGFALGEVASALDRTWIDPMIWLTAMLAVIAVRTERMPGLIPLSSAFAIPIAVAIARESVGPQPAAGVQALGAGLAVLALANGLGLAASCRLRAPVAAMFGGAALCAMFASLRVERIWTTSTLVLLAGSTVLISLLHSEAGAGARQTTEVSSNDSRMWFLFAGAIGTGSSLLVASAVTEEPFGWPVAGAVAAGLGGIAFLLSEEIQERRSTFARLEHAAAESRVDELTGLANRRGIDERLSNEIARAKRFGHSLAVLMIDADDFKRINDHLGHAAGDRALRQLGIAIQESIRGIDTAGRYGGEEFLVILPETGMTGALVVAERIRSAVEQTRAATISIGISKLSQEANTAATLLDAADDALYLAKSSGKNCVRSAG